MKIPLKPEELRAALRNLSTEKIDKKKMDEVREELITVMPKRKKDLNKAIADYHGISVEKLMNSPDFKDLCRKYEEYTIRQVAEKFEKKFSITEKEAWALLAYALGWPK